MADELSDREFNRLERERVAIERSNTEKSLKAEYWKIKDTLAFQDLLSKVKAFIELHKEVAVTAIGSDGEKIIRLDQDQRVAELDKAAGQTEILDYLYRKLTITPNTNEKEKPHE